MSTILVNSYPKLSKTSTTLHPRYRHHISPVPLQFIAPETFVLLIPIAHMHFESNQRRRVMALSMSCMALIQGTSGFARD